MEFYNTLDEFVQGELAKLQRLQNACLPERGIITKVLAPAENQDRKTNIDGFSLTHGVDYLEVDNLGIYGDRHRRAVRSSTAREKNVYLKGSVISEHRHVFAVSEYDCRVLSEKLDVDVTPELLGANIVIGREDGRDYSLSMLPQGTHLLLGLASESELARPPLVTLVKYVTQQGCVITGNAIRAAYDKNTEMTPRFVEVAKENRGIVCSVEYPVEHTARIEAGQKVFFKYAKGVCP